MTHDRAPVQLAAADPSPAVGVHYCPECGMPAWVEWRDTVGSTQEPVDLVKVRCFARHWFLMPAAGLDAA